MGSHVSLKRRTNHGTWVGFPEDFFPEPVTLESVRAKIAEMPTDQQERFETFADSTEVTYRKDDGAEIVLKTAVDRTTKRIPYEPGNDVWHEVNVDEIAAATPITSLTRICLNARLPHGTTHVRVVSATPHCRFEKALGYRAGPGYETLHLLRPTADPELWRKLIANERYEVPIESTE